ncbi:MAG: TolC family protein, partial [Planctomycetota bacterium]
MDRELAEAGADVEPLLTTRDEGGLERLELREDLLEEVERDYNPDRYFLEEGELEAEAPERRVSQIDELVGKDLLGRDQRVVSLGLQRAIRSAVANNLTTQAARLTPAIAEASVVEAEAAFDWVFTTSVAWQDTDTPGSGAGFLGLDETVQASQSINSTTSLRRPLTTGGELSIAQEFVYSDIRSSGFGPLPSPNPGSTASYTIGIDQPLLRGFGSDVALAQVRLARNEERRQIAALKTTLLDLVTSTENAYWDLVASHRELIISARVLERGETVRDEIKVRRVLDAIQAQVADAVATTERRRGELITARRELRRASDALKRLMNDPELPVGSEIMLIPADDGVDEPIRYSLVDAIRTASNERPELDSAVLDIDDASIGTVVA